MNAPAKHPKQARAGAMKRSPQPKGPGRRSLGEDGFEIIWTNHAAKRMVQRQFDPDEVMEAIAHLCASGLLNREKPTSITHGKFKVVAKEADRDPRHGNVGQRICLIITVTYAGRGLNVPRHKRKRSRNQELRNRRRH